MKTIWTFRFGITDFQQLAVPVGAEPLYAGLDADARPSLWCLVDDKAAKEPLDLFVVGTGNPMPPDANRYLGTFVWKITGTVWHVFTS